MRRKYSANARLKRTFLVDVIKKLKCISCKNRIEEFNW